MRTARIHSDYEDERQVFSFSLSQRANITVRASGQSGRKKPPVAKQKNKNKKTHESYCKKMACQSVDGAVPRESLYIPTPEQAAVEPPQHVKLMQLGRTRRQVVGDGNCFYYAMCHQLGRPNPDSSATQLLRRVAR